MGVWPTSGWYCTAQIFRSTDSKAATGASGVEAVAWKPAGGTVTASKWLIHTSCSAGMPSWSRLDGPAPVRVSRVRPYSPRIPRPTVPAELLCDQLGPVADPQDRDAEVVDPGIERGGALDVHALRAARQDDRRWRTLLHLGRGDAMRHDLGVHPELANASGDQLGVLRTEVDDQHGVAS